MDGPPNGRRSVRRASDGTCVGPSSSAACRLGTRAGSSRSRAPKILIADSGDGCFYEQGGPVAWPRQAAHRGHGAAVVDAHAQRPQSLRCRCRPFAPAQLVPKRLLLQSRPLSHYARAQAPNRPPRSGLDLTNWYLYVSIQRAQGADARQVKAAGTEGGREKSADASVGGSAKAGWDRGAARDKGANP